MATNGTPERISGSITPGLPPFAWLCRRVTLAYALLVVVAFAATFTLAQPQPLVALESAQFFAFAALWGAWSLIVTLALLCWGGRWLSLGPISPLWSGVALWLLWVAVTAAVGGGAYLLGWLDEAAWIARAGAIAALIGWGLWWTLAGWREEFAQRLLAQEAQQAALLARTQPHFLLNSLNTVASLLPDRPDEAERAISALAELLHQALAAPHPWSLAKELAAVRTYLYLATLRYGPRLIVEWQMAGDANRLPQIVVPRWVVVPLVENSVVHAVARRREPTQIAIAITVTEDEVAVRIANPLAPEGSAGTAHHGLGLAIVRAQLQRCGATFTATQAGGQFVAEWRLPVRQQDSKAERNRNGDLADRR